MISRGHGGASLLETTMAIAVAAILMSGAATAIYSTVLASRESAAIGQLEGIKKGIVGEPHSADANRSGFRHGYLGDMGSLPPALTSLMTAGSQPDFAVDPLLQLGAGWRGPYVSTAVAAAFVDPWGGDVVYSTTPGTSPTTGAPTIATLRSSGPDVQPGTADDYVVEIYESEGFSRVIGFVKDSTGSTVPGVGVTVSYPLNGAVTSQTQQTDDAGLYSFDDIPFGPQVLQLEPKLSYLNGSAITTGGNRNNVNFTVENLARLSTSVSSIRLTWTTDPPSDFKRLLVDGDEVFDGTVPSGTTLFFSSESVAGTGVLQEPFRVEVSSLVMQVPDAIIGSVGTGGALIFRLEDFEEVGNNSDVDVTGVTFTAEFSDGSVTQFSPLRK